MGDFPFFWSIVNCQTLTQVTVGTSPFVMSLSREVFGSDAHLFRPERWLQESRGEMRE